MSSIQKLAYVWSLPDRTQDRAQITLRLSYDLYAKLHALKAVYLGRSVNDIICDLLSASIDELVDTFSEHVYSEADLNSDIELGIPRESLPSVGQAIGRRVDFEQTYLRILQSKEGSVNE